LKSFVTIAIVNGYEAVNVIRSELNDFSVVIETESWPTSLPLMYKENQLSAHTSAVNEVNFPVVAAVVVVTMLDASSGITAATLVLVTA
jgi:hypothetical protein